MTLLIIEDEPGLQLGLRHQFEDAGYDVHVTGTGSEALNWLNRERSDMVILDLGLPDMDGTQVLENIAKHFPDLPVLVLTARASETDVVQGFKLGAMDYVTKPFSPRILLARVTALMKRAGAEGEVRLGRLRLDFERYRASMDEAPIKLTTREFELLKFLYRHRGKPVSRHDILDEIWGLDSDAGPRTVDTHVALLRKKIEPNANRPQYLLSQRGIGYKLAME